MCKMRKRFIENIKAQAVDIDDFMEVILHSPKVLKTVQVAKPMTFAAVSVEILGDRFTAIGEARCNPSDEWSDEIGEDIAVSRAAATLWRMVTGREPTAELEMTFNAFGVELEISI